jgi:heme exporter protein A
MTARAIRSTGAMTIRRLIARPALPTHMTPPPLPPADAAAPTLSTAALGGQRGDRPLFRRLALTLRPGQVTWLRGRNGRGKTSLLRLLAGLATPAHGEVLLDGHPLRKLAPEWRQRLLYIAHANALKDDLTVTESLRFLSQLHGAPVSGDEITAALARLGIGFQAKALVRTLSQGQRRRVALARLALPQPVSVWLLDEPFDALDTEGVLALNGLLSEQARRGGSALLTSHQALSLRDPVPQTLDLDDFAVAG